MATGLPLHEPDRPGGTRRRPLLRSVNEGAEAFEASVSGSWLVRTVTLRDGSQHRSRLPASRLPPRKPSQDRLAKLYDEAFLRSRHWPVISPEAKPIRIADLFSGCGIMSLGAWEACRALGYLMQPKLAVDLNRNALDVYSHNFPSARAVCAPIETLLDGEIGEAQTEAEERLVRETGRIDLVVGGPPCQGHSDLNNHTRRNDPKNRLYERMARFAEIFSPLGIVIENVPAVRHDRGGVVDRTLERLRELGYSLDEGIVDVDLLGVPQRRRRHIVLASRNTEPSIDCIVREFARSPRSVRWAIADLQRSFEVTGIDEAAVPTELTRERIDYLFDNDLRDLPDHMRPDCHRLKKHSYRSVYGRLSWDEPAQTITSGFTCMGQGRYVHPAQRRTLTPHEAARLQFIPDFFSFSKARGRTVLAEMIGNAVPTKLAYVAAIEVLR